VISITDEVNSAGRVVLDGTTAGHNVLGRAAVDGTVAAAAARRHYSADWVGPDRRVDSAA